MPDTARELFTKVALVADRYADSLRRSARCPPGPQGTGVPAEHPRRRPIGAASRWRRLAGWVVAAEPRCPRWARRSAEWEVAGLSALVAGYKQAIATGQGLCVAGLLPHIARLFQTTAIDTLITVYQTLHDALPEALAGHGQPEASSEDGQSLRGVPLETYLARDIAQSPQCPT